MPLAPKPGATGPQAPAPAGESDAIQEIVVTAEKRSESLQTVPVSVTVTRT